METPSTKALNAQYAAREIPIDLIDDPEVPERETMEETDLGELALNIQQIGLIKPLIVKPKGERYECVAGHRRLIACRMVKYSPIPCRVVVKGKVDTLAILVAENAHTEAVNAVEEARFYQRLLDERCGNDVDALCIVVKKRREYVEDRLLILRGDPKITDALQAKKISFAVARELNKLQDPNRRLMYLDVAINQGASARQVMEWRRSAELMAPIDLPEDNGAAGVNGDVAAAPAWQMKCMCCDGTEDPHLMQTVFLHGDCLKFLQRMIAKQAAGAA